MRRFLSLLIGLGAVMTAGANPWQPFCALAVSPDGRFLATGGMGGEVLVWESLTGEVLSRWSLSSGKPVAGLAFDDAGGLGVAGLDGGLFVTPAREPAPHPLDPAAPAWRELSQAPSRWLEGGAPASGTRTDRGTLSARGASDGSITVGRLAWQAHPAPVTGLAWSPDGTVLYSVSYDGGLASWDPRTGNLRSRL